MRASQTFTISDVGRASQKRFLKAEDSYRFLLQNHFGGDLIKRERGRDLTQSYDESPYTHRKIQKAT